MSCNHLTIIKCPLPTPSKPQTRNHNFQNRLRNRFLASIFTFPTVIYNRGKVLESAQEISKISRCFVLWEP